VVLGARTRLGLAWLSSSDAASYDRILIARHQAEADALKGQFPGDTVCIANDTPLPSLSPARVVVLAFALGLIHPTNSGWTTERTNTSRDLQVIDSVLEAFPDIPIRLVYISSVLALSPRGTVWYGGWKNVIEGALMHQLASRPNASLCVLYPGRLVEARKPGFSFLYTLFSKLAERVSQAASSEAPYRRLVGVDARLWLLARGLPTWLVRLDKHA
jgi:hypothetical protein